MYRGSFGVLPRAMDLFKVDNKCFLVTGGTSGIGRMIVTGLVEEGARVYTCARSKDSCAALEAELANSQNYLF